MNLPTIDKKLRESEFFLSKMRHQESRAFGDKEPFDFYLSAFLSAARTVDNRLRHEQAALYPPWRKVWDSSHPAEDDLLKFLTDDRNVEVHESGSKRVEKTKSLPVRDVYDDSSGTVVASGPPGTPPATVGQPYYCFMIHGVERRATEVCADCVHALEQMVRQFQADHP